MGRGRAKAKQTRVARELKYSSPSTDLDALQRELGVNGGGPEPPGAGTAPGGLDDEDDALEDGSLGDEAVADGALGDGALGDGALGDGALGAGERWVPRR